MGQDINIGTINGLDVDQILDKMVEKKIGISGGSTGIKDGEFNSGTVLGSLVSGETVRFDGLYWVVAHTDYINRIAYLASIIIVTRTAWGSSNASYKNSTLASVALEFELNMSDAARALMLDTTVEDTVAKVFAPTITMSEKWAQFLTAAGRVCTLNGANYDWWTSSPSGGYVRCIAKNGNLNTNTYGDGFRSCTDTAAGFRPCIALPL